MACGADEQSADAGCVLRYAAIAASKGFLLFLRSREPAVYPNRRVETGIDGDWSNRQVDAHVTTVRHSGGETSKGQPAITQDFEFANQIFAQAGLTIRQAAWAGVQNYDVPTNGFYEGADEVASQHRGAADQVNVWYWEKIAPTMGGTAMRPNQSSTTEPGRTDGIFVDRYSPPDTLAHEFGHFLLGSLKDADGVFRAHDKFYKHDSGDRNNDHQPDFYNGQNLMSEEPERVSSGSTYVPKSAANNAPAEPLLIPYTRPGVSQKLYRSQLNGQVYFDADGDWVRDWNESLAAR